VPGSAFITAQTHHVYCAAKSGVCITELDAGGSVINVPPAPSEVALKFPAVYWPSLDAPASKFRILKNHRAETRREIRGFPCRQCGFADRDKLLKINESSK
jgi:hypothetical protein